MKRVEEKVFTNEEAHNIYNLRKLLANLEENKELVREMIKKFLFPYCNYCKNAPSCWRHNWRNFLIGGDGGCINRKKTNRNMFRL